NFQYIKEKLNQSNKMLYEGLEDIHNKTYLKFTQLKQKNDSQPLSEKELNFLWELHLELNEVKQNLGIGMRIVKQVESYLLNLPTNNVVTRKEAFDLQITQRIITKITGSKRQLM